MSYLGLDYGAKQVGVALSEGVQAQGLVVLETKEVIPRLRQITKAHQVHVVVLGLPEGRFKPQVMQFGQEIETQLGLPVVLWDEALSSRQAQTELVKRHTTSKRRRVQEHAVAAAAILADYLSEIKTYDKRKKTFSS